MPRDRQAWLIGRSSGTRQLRAVKHADEHGATRIRHASLATKTLDVTVEK